MYLAGIAVGSALLLLPVATSSGESAPLIHAAFTAVSCPVTGLTVNTATYWSPGWTDRSWRSSSWRLRDLTLLSLLPLVVTGRISLQGSLIAGQELRAGLGSVLRVPRMILKVMFTIEALVAFVLTLAFRPHADGWASATWYGVFHAVSAFNNAGFALFSDNLVSFVGDPAIIVPICVAIVLGGLGFPVLFEVGHRFFGRGRGHRARWSVNSRLAIAGTLSLLVLGAAVFAFAEWNNPRTLGLPAAR